LGRLVGAGLTHNSGRAPSPAPHTLAVHITAPRSLPLTQGVLSLLLAELAGGYQPMPKPSPFRLPYPRWKGRLLSLRRSRAS
jgi:hypothetical protein